jgi:hypothetical protein
MGERLTPQQTKQLEDALAAGSKIEAIRLYREFTRQDLHVSKRFIDQLVLQLIQRDPAKFEKLLQKSKGCGTVVVCLVLSIGIGFFLLI